MSPRRHALALWLLGLAPLGGCHQVCDEGPVPQSDYFAGIPAGVAVCRESTPSGLVLCAKDSDEKKKWRDVELWFRAEGWEHDEPLSDEGPFYGMQLMHFRTHGGRRQQSTIIPDLGRAGDTYGESCYAVGFSDRK